MTDILIKLFVRDHKNTGNPAVRDRYGKLSGAVGIATNLVLFAIKITVGLLFNSIAITADAINNLSDSGSSLITLLGFKMSGRPADAKHPYGHARMEYIAGLVVSMVVLLLGLQLIQTSVGKIIKPSVTVFNWITGSILAISILIKLWQSQFYRKVGRRIDSTTLLATSIDSRNDIIATAAVLISGLILVFTGLNLDGYMGVAVAIFIIISGIRLIQDTISPLIGMAPTKELVDTIYSKIMSYDNIIGLHDLTIHNYGVTRRFASVHCEVPAEQDIMYNHDVIDNIERDIFREFGINLVVHLDPVAKDDERTTQLKEIVRCMIRDVSPLITIHDFRVVWGVTHSNLIFDVVVPYDFNMSDEELIGHISDKILELSQDYRTVIAVDHSYIPIRNIEDN